MNRTCPPSAAMYFWNLLHTIHCYNFKNWKTPEFLWQIAKRLITVKHTIFRKFNFSGLRKMDIVNTVNGLEKEILQYLILTLFVTLYQWHIKGNDVPFLKAPSHKDIRSNILNISSIWHFIIFVSYLVTRTSKLFMASEVFWQKLFHSGSVQVMELSPGDNIDDRRTSWGRKSGRTSSFTRRAVARNWFSNPWIKWSEKRQYMWMC